MAGSPLVLDGRVYVCPCGRDGRSLAAFDAESGAEIFRVRDGKITEVWNPTYTIGRWG